MPVSLDHVFVADCVGTPVSETFTVSGRHPLWMEPRSFDVSRLDLDASWPTYRGPADEAEVQRCRLDRRLSRLAYGEVVIDVAAAVR